MTKKLYKLMNWAEIEGIVYSEEDNPHKLLGITQVTGGTLVQFLSKCEKGNCGYEKFFYKNGTGG